MIKNIIAELRWGPLTSEQQQELKTLSFWQVIKRPYLKPKLHSHW